MRGGPASARLVLARQRRTAGVAAAGTILAQRTVLVLEFARVAIGPVGEAEAFGAVGHGLALGGRLPARPGRTQRRIGSAASQLNGGGLGQIAVEIDAGFVGEPLAELLAQHAGLDHLDAADGQIVELERAEADADQPVDLEAERAEDVLDLAVLAFAQGEQQPDIAALLALERRLDRAVLDAVDLDAVLEAVELRLGDGAEGADAISAQPAGGGQFEDALQAAVIGEQQQALGVDVEPADGDDARQALLLRASRRSSRGLRGPFR